jgi:hypothetical protein
MNKKKVISKHGLVFYLSIEKNKGTGSWYLKLYDKVEYGFWKFKLPFYKELHERLLTTDSISDTSFQFIKRESIRMVEDYESIILKDRVRERMFNNIQTEFYNWDGYLGNDDDPMRKKLMRDDKLQSLLKGDMSKLEKYLDDN